MILQIVTGTIVAVVSFLFGYFLFIVQRKEAIRLELYKRRLESYDRIMALLQQIDQDIITKDFDIDQSIKDKFVSEIYNLTLPNRHYLSKDVYNLLEEAMVNCIDDLPETAADLEEVSNNIIKIISNEVGSYLIHPRTMRRILGNRRLNIYDGQIEK